MLLAVYLNMDLLYLHIIYLELYIVEFVLYLNLYNFSLQQARNLVYILSVHV